MYSNRQSVVVLGVRLLSLGVSYLKRGFTKKTSQRGFGSDTFHFQKMM
jgi:hypothetical protein